MENTICGNTTQRPPVEHGGFPVSSSMKAFQVENTTEWSGNISGGLRALISDRCQIEVGGRPPTLERHRAEVARLRAKGLTGRAIAKELRIQSPRLSR